MSQALYRKWRPRKWDQVVAQNHVVQTLRNAIKADRVGHAYLFSGPRGTGKTTTARLLAKAVNCLSDDLQNRPCDMCKNCLAVNDGRFMDLIEIDAASNTSVEDVRDLREKINFSPSDGRYKVYIIDEVHMLSTAAFNALLKTLEEPPPHAMFILATTEVQKIPATVLSRCQRHEFRRIPVMDIVETLKSLCGSEKIEADEDALILIARQSTGALRDAISLLDQLASAGGKIDLDLAQTVLGTSTNQLVLELIDSVQKNDTAKGLETIHKALDSGSDPRQYARQVVEYLRGLLLIRMGNEKQVEASQETRQIMRAQCQSIPLESMMEWIENFNDAINDMRTSWEPSLALEIAYAKCLQPGETSSTQPLVPAKKGAIKPEESGPVVRQNENEIKKTTAKSEDSEPAQVEKQPEKLHDPEVEPSPTTQVEGSLTTQDVMGAWSQIRQEVKQKSSPTEGLLNSQKFIQVKDGVLILGFSSEVLRSKMENPENLAVTRKAIQSILKQDLPVQCIVLGNKPGTAAQDGDVEADGLVRTAIDLGGKLVHKEKE